MRRLAILLIAIFAAPLLAQAGDVYQIKDVNITLANVAPAKARDEAMQEGEKKAFDELQKTLLEGGYVKDKKDVTPAQISSAVDSIDIVSEKSGVNYSAVYNIVFSKIEISRLLSIGEIAATEDPEKYLVVPVVISDGKMKIWKNEWLKNWEGEKHDDITIPLGDLQDVQNLKEDDITAKKYEGMLRLEKRYGTNNFVLVKAEYLKEKRSLSVVLEKIKDRERIAVTYEYPGGPGISLSDLYEAAANDIVTRLENKKLTDNNPDKPAAKLPEPYSPNAPGTGYVGEKKPPYQPITVTAAPATSQAMQTDITIIAPDLIAWNRIRSKLTATPGINDLKIKSFVGGKANITINKNDDMSVLSSSLSSEGLELSGTEGSWQIKEKK